MAQDEGKLMLKYGRGMAKVMMQKANKKTPANYGSSSEITKSWGSAPDKDGPGGITVRGTKNQSHGKKARGPMG